MSANPLPPAIVHMTGPHPSRTRREGKPHFVWSVAVVAADDQEPTSTVYRCLSYRRANEDAAARMQQARKVVRWGFILGNVGAARDTVRVCFCLSGKNRPARFSSAPFTDRRNRR